jgi:heme/copper-type cytochrome/quinol oxidase subunit 2
VRRRRSNANREEVECGNNSMFYVGSTVSAVVFGIVVVLVLLMRRSRRVAVQAPPNSWTASLETP